MSLVAIIAVYFAGILALTVLNRRHLMTRQMVWLEITPPLSIHKTPEATVQLFSVIHGMHAARQLKEKLLRRSPVISFEITSTKQQGIRYLIQVETTRSAGLQKAISSYIPDSKVKEIEMVEHPSTKVIEFKQQGHYVLPLTRTELFEQHDPLGYITGVMTKLEDNEQLTLQLVITPVRLREARQLYRKIMANEDILRSVQQGTRITPMSKIFETFSTFAMATFEMIGEIHSGTTSGYNKTKQSNKSAQFQQQVNTRQRPARTLSTFEHELMESMHEKVTQPLFQVNLRVLLVSNNEEEHMAAIRSALDAYSVPPYQELKTKIQAPLINTRRQRLADKRLPAILRSNSLILSTAEIASLYHFPSSQISKTDNLISSLSKTLPAPISLKSGKQLAIRIGENKHHGTTTAIGLTDLERERHLYIIGGTGNGKTTMLFYSILQDIRSGNGVAILDPHGDLAERILRYIPEGRIGDVVYMNPDDLSYPIGMNLLELTEGLSGDDLLREKDLITEATISVLRKVFSDDDSGGHRIEYVLRNAIQTALTLEDSTLFTIFQLLNDAKYRRKVVKELKDKNLKDFWNNELGKAGEFQRVKMAAGITAKIGRFLFSASARRILEQPKSTINFEDILATKKILVCNFSKGMLGEDTSALFGTTVLAKLQTAALHRARVAQDNRKAFYLYVDEFQNFATMSFVQMLSEARKYKLFLTMAEQSTSQQDEKRLVDIILANVGTIVCFRSGSPSDERLVLPLFSPFIDQGEIANLPAYSYYVRIAAVEAQEPASGVTVVVTDPGRADIAKHVIASSRRLYANRVVDAAVESRSFTRKKTTPKKLQKRSTELASIKTIT